MVLWLLLLLSLFFIYFLCILMLLSVIFIFVLCVFLYWGFGVFASSAHNYGSNGVS